MGPVAVTSLILGNGLGDTIDAPIQANPNAPVNQRAQDEYNHAAIQASHPHPPCLCSSTDCCQRLYLSCTATQCKVDTGMQTARAAVQVAFIAGIMYTLVGLFNLGWITNFISHTVISGFMSGAAIIIGLSQVCASDSYPNWTLYPFPRIPSIAVHGQCITSDRRRQKKIASQLHRTCQGLLFTVILDVTHA